MNYSHRLLLIVGAACLFGTTTPARSQPDATIEGAARVDVEESIPAVAGPLIDASNFDRESQFIDAIRRQPWNRGAFNAFVAWLDKHDPPRAELVRLQLKLNPLSYDAPGADALRAAAEKLLDEHGAEWTAPAASLGAATIRFGLIDSLNIATATDELVGKLQSAVPSVRTLVIQSHTLTPAGLIALTKLPYLDGLLIETGVLTPAMLKEMEAFGPRVKLRTDERKTDAAAFASMNARRLARFDQLTPAEKYEAGVRFVGAVGFDPAFGRPTRNVMLSQSSTTDDEMRLVAAIPDLEQLLISGSTVTEQGLTHLADQTKLQLIHLYLPLASLDPLRGCTELRELTFAPEGNTELTDAGLAALESFKNLESLTLLGEYSLADGDVSVRRIGSLKKLKKLHFTATEFDDEACLAALADLSELDTLRIAANGLTDRALAHVTRFPNLRVLDVRISSRHGLGRADFSALKKLNYLQLSGAGVTDKLLTNTRLPDDLETLQLDEASVSRDVAEAIAAKSRQILIISDTFVVTKPAPTMSFQRMRLGDSVSLTVPRRWKEHRPVDGKSVWFNEDGWEEVKHHSGKVGAASVGVYFADNAGTLAEAIDKEINKYDFRPGTVVQRNLELLDDIESESAVYDSFGDRSMVLAVKSPAGIVVLEAKTGTARFAELAPLFTHMAKSLRVGADPERHRPEIVEVKSEDFPPSPLDE